MSRWSGISRKQSYSGQWDSNHQSYRKKVQGSSFSGSSVGDFSKGPRNLWDTCFHKRPPLPFPFPGILIGTCMGVWEWASPELCQETHFPRWFKGGISFILGLFQDCWFKNHFQSSFASWEFKGLPHPKCHPFRKGIVDLKGTDMRNCRKEFSSDEVRSFPTKNMGKIHSFEILWICHDGSLDRRKSRVKSDLKQPTIDKHTYV